MLEAVPHRSRTGVMAGACAATAVASAAGAVWGAARVARWAATLAPDEHPVPESGAETAPRVVVPLVKPGNGHSQATSNYDVGDTMHTISDAVQA
jgi:hypothetical protein